MNSSTAGTRYFAPVDRHAQQRIGLAVVIVRHLALPAVHVGGESDQILHIELIVGTLFIGLDEEFAPHQLGGPPRTSSPRSANDRQRAGAAPLTLEPLAHTAAPPSESMRTNSGSDSGAKSAGTTPY